MMQARSETWKQIAQSARFRCESVAEIAGVTYASISAPVIERGMFPQALSIGNCVSASLRLSIRSENDIAPSSSIKIKNRIVSESEELTSEYLPAGTFWISRRSYDVVNGLITLTCYDAMLKTNANYPIGNAANWPKTQSAVVEEIAGLIGVEIDPRTVIDPAAPDVEKPSGYTIQQVLGFIGAANAGNWVISKDNKLRLIPVEGAPTVAGLGSDYATLYGVMGKLTTGRHLTVSGVILTSEQNQETNYTAGDDSGYVISCSVPFASQELCDLIYSKVAGIAYRPYTASKGLYDPASELGDPIVRLEDPDASVTDSGVIINVLSRIYSETATYSFAFRGSVSAPANAEIEDEFPYIGTAGKKGQDGRSIIGQTVSYAESEGVDIDPADLEWSAEMPQTAPGHYLWTRTTFLYSSEPYEESTYTATRQGEDGMPGTGTGETVTYYLASDKASGVTSADPGWTLEPQTISAEKRYLWTYQVTKYSKEGGDYETTTKARVVSFFNDGDAVPLKDLKVYINPVQSGSGDPSPDNVRAITGWDSVKVLRSGKNLINGAFAAATGTNKGITYEYDGNGRMTVTGTTTGANTDTANKYFGGNTGRWCRTLLEAGKTYTLSFAGTFEVSNDEVRIRFMDANNHSLWTGNSGVGIWTFTPDEDFLANRMAVRFARTGNTVNLDGYFQLEAGSAATEYEPYTDDFYDISLSAAGTVYSGVLDVLSGELTVDRKFIAVDGSTVKFTFASSNNTVAEYKNAIFGIPSADALQSASASAIPDMIANRAAAISYNAAASKTSENYGVTIVDVGVTANARVRVSIPKSQGVITVAEANTWLASHNLQIVYPLASPVSYTLTPQQVASLVGQNHIWSDAGEIEVTYSTDAYITDAHITGVYGDKGDKGEQGEAGHSPEITTEKIGTVTKIYADGVEIGSVDDGADGSTPAITATKSGGVTTVKVDGQSIATINDGSSVTIKSATKADGQTTLVLVDSSGEHTLTIDDGTDGDDGQPGDSGYVHIAWANSADGTVGFSTSSAAGKTYLGSYTDNTATDSSRPQDYNWARIQGPQGEPGSDGDNGVGIASERDYFTITDSDSDVPDDPETDPTIWTADTPPTRDVGEYIWRCHKTMYTDNSVAYSTPVCITGDPGDQGSQGVGIASERDYFTITNSDSEAPDDPETDPTIWTADSPPQRGYKEYIWRCHETTYTDGSVAYATPVCITGDPGDSSLTLIISSDKGSAYNYDAFAELTGDIYDANMNLVDPEGEEFIIRWWITQDGQTARYLNGGKSLVIAVNDSLCEYMSDIWFETIPIEENVFPFLLCKRDGTILTSRRGFPLSAAAAERYGL